MRRPQHARSLSRALTLATVVALTGAALAAGPVEDAAAARSLSDAQTIALRQDRFLLDKKRVAIDGYDPVAYFPEGGGAPAKGDKKFAFEHRGVIYHFASQANLDRFKAAPDTYEPAYGGWCAYAMAHEGYTEVNPKTFAIENGRLLLFYNGLLGNTLKNWNKEGPAALTPKADAYWKAELDKAAQKIADKG
jgi:YHS domain-containing protein